MGVLESQTPQTPQTPYMPGSEEAALHYRHRQAMRVIADLAPGERLSLLAAVVAPSPELLEASLAAVEAKAA